MGSPEQMRDAVVGFVRALHAAYLEQADRLPPGERAELPLPAQARRGRLTVVAAGAGELHIVATGQELPAPRPPEVAIDDELGDLRWTTRFYDPVVLPALGLVTSGSDASAHVRALIGVRDVVYHLSVSPGGGLTPHHAQHAGTGLANQHASAARDHEALRAALPRQAGLVDELAAAERVGLVVAHRLLAGRLAQDLHDRDLDRVLADETADPAAVRRALLVATRAGQPVRGVGA